MRRLKINDDGKERKVEYVKEIIHQVPDIYGNIVDEEYVEIMVIGKNWNWKKWIPLEDFKKENPEVEL